MNHHTQLLFISLGSFLQSRGNKNTKELPCHKDYTCYTACFYFTTCWEILGFVKQAFL